LPDGRTEVREHIEYDFPAGPSGLWTRLLFGRLALRGLFTARKILTRRGLKRDRISRQAGVG
jgi:hypothetical protein